MSEDLVKVKPKIIELSPSTVEAIRPRKLFFSIYSGAVIQMSKGLCAELGRIKGICFGYSEDGVFLWSDPYGFKVSMSGTSYEISSAPLVDALLGPANLKRRMRYYVEQVEGMKYKVSFAQETKWTKKEKAPAYQFEKPEVVNG